MGDSPRENEASVRSRLNELGGAVPTKAERSPKAFDAYVKAEVARWEPILKDTAK